MRKISIILFLAATLSGCKTVSLIGFQEINLKAGTSKFESGNPMVVLVDVDRFKNVPMLFDTGCSVSYITSDSIFDKSKQRKIVTFGKTTVADGKTFQTQLTEFEINTPWFESPDKAMALNFQTGYDCPTKLPFYGLIGIDVFRRRAVVVEINFDKNEITTHYANSKPDSLIFKDYVKIKSTSDRESFYIYPTIFGKEHKMMFDTGNLSAVYLPASEMPKDYTPIRIIDGISIKTASNFAGNETYILDDVTMTINNHEIKTSLSIINNLEISNVGLPFLRRFNWLIDFKNEEIWISKDFTKQYTDDQMELKSQMCLIVDDKIKLVAKLRDAHFKVGDIVKSVNGEEVVAGNNCRLLKKLNEENWENLKIEIE